MGRKIFVTYKYTDEKVHNLDGKEDVIVRDYVDRLEHLIEGADHIYKGEKDDETLDMFKTSTVESKLKERIFDSSITIVMISKGMRDKNRPDEDQWIPWEIAYSLKNISRDEKKSKPNAVLAIVLPDEKNRYGYFLRYKSGKNAVTYYNKNTFRIIRENMFNLKQKKGSKCKGKTSYRGHCSYIHCVAWNDFLKDINKHLDTASHIRENIDNYELRKVV